MPPLVSIVIVNWKTPDLLMACIESIKKNDSGHKNFEFLIVDIDRAILSALPDKRLGEGFARVLSGKIEKHAVADLATAGKAVEAELEGNLLVGSCPFPDRYAKGDGLEVKKPGWEAAILQGL